MLIRGAASAHGLLLRTSDPERAKRAFANVIAGDFGETPRVRLRIVDHPEGNLAIEPIAPAGEASHAES